ncbi:hypothetical protein [Maribellus maritimus]|uniref:hypothetical protein n=1 Tax=Maribellus maritimus TaxID=2870838 RepID=UPI001EEABDBB|nr:hypothetical protein [Maribellus maritimus]MCG6190319.1 hypothetical protein [Maribellus maritimus]
MGVLFGSILAYTGWTGVGTQTFLMGKTSEISGKVIEVFPNKEVQNFSRKIKYVYSVDDNFYVDFKKLGTEDAKQEIGNDLKLIYSIKKPERNRVQRLSSNYDNSVGKKYYSTKENGYIELRLINGIFKYKEAAVGGKIIHDFVGEYKIINDSIKFENYIFETDNEHKNRPELFVLSPGNHRQLVDVSTKKIFKRFH